MKKLFSYAFIVLILMNVMGYYGVFLGLNIRNDAFMERHLDVADFDPSQLLNIQVPLSIPYATNDDAFERVDGKFEYHGEVFRLLKQKFANDTLSIICVKDTKAGMINKALSAYVKTFTDQHSPAASGKFVITLIKDYLPQSFSFLEISSSWQRDIILNESAKHLISSYESGIIHPPEQA